MTETPEKFSETTLDLSTAKTIATVGYLWSLIERTCTHMEEAHPEVRECQYQKEMRKYTRMMVLFWLGFDDPEEEDTYLMRHVIGTIDEFNDWENPPDVVRLLSVLDAVAAEEKCPSMTH